MEILDNLAHSYPLMRGGGALFILVGLGIIIGGIGGRRWMLPALIVGAALALITLVALSRDKADLRRAWIASALPVDRHGRGFCGRGHTRELRSIHHN